MSNASINDGAIMLTHCDDGEPALLTVRGKDHDLDADALRGLGAACLATAHRMDHAARGVAPFDIVPFTIETEAQHDAVLGFIDAFFGVASVEYLTMVSASEAYEAKHHPMVDGDG